jgi:imidazolonepropionase-like amidohydrolase
MKRLLLLFVFSGKLLSAQDTLSSPWDTTGYAELDREMMSPTPIPANETDINAFLLEFSKEKLQQQHSCYIAFKNVAVVDAEDNKIRKHRTVIVHDGQVISIKLYLFTFSLKGAKVVDGKGKYLAPGLTDMHVHFTCTNRDRLEFLLYGVTRIRNMSGSAYSLSDKAFVDAGEILSPKVYSCGPEVFPFYNNDTARIREEAGNQFAAGYDFLKAGRSLTDTALYTMLDAARKLGMPVAIELPNGIKPSDLSKYKDLITIEGFTAYENDRKAWAKDPGDFWFCPAFASYSELAATKTAKAFEKKPENSIVSETQSRLIGQSPQFLFSMTAGYRSKRNFFKAGAKKQMRFLTGTESGLYIPMLIPGISLHNELKELQQLGLKTDQVILAATRNAAIVLRDEMNSGRIREGETTDLLLLDDDPLEKIENYKKITGMLVNGAWLSSADLGIIKNKLEMFR